MSNHLIDGKSRLAIPTDLRGNLIKETIENGQVRRKTVLAIGFRRTLAIWHPDEWEEKEAKRSESRLTPAQKLLADATYMLVDVDPQFRIRIPVDYRNLCLLPREPVTVVGSGDHVLVWDAERWVEFMKAASHELESSDGSPGP